MIDNNLVSFLKNTNIIDQLNAKNKFLTFQAQKGQITGWKIITLGKFELFVRKVFGCFHKNTHQKTVSDALKAGLNSLIAFDENASNIKDIVRISQKVLRLNQTENLSERIPNEKLAVISRPNEIDKFKKSVAFVDENRTLFDELKEERITFKIRPNGADRLSVKISEGNLMILTKKMLGRGGFKTVKTALNLDAQKPLARATMVVSHPRMGRISRFFNNLVARKELESMKKVQDDPTCIHLESSDRYQGKNARQKVAMFMELADGDLSQLIRYDLTDEQRIDIASQLIDGLASLSRRNIWHRDMKPLNFLYFKRDNKYKVVVADFGLATRHKDLFAEKFPAGTILYMAPENFQFFRLQNGKKGDVFSMGKTLSELFPLPNRPAFVQQLIEEMLHPNPKIRPSAETVQEKFRQALVK